MGAWGTGHFENDEALDLIGELDSESCAGALQDIFEAALSAGSQGEQIDATDSSRAMAAAELIAAARGHAANGFPDDAAPLLQSLNPPSDELLEKAVSAVSQVLLSSELIELWAKSDDPAEWNKSVSDLIARLDAPARTKKLSKKQREGMTAAVCSFCSEQIPATQFVSLDLRRPWDPIGLSRGIFAHEACLNAKLHPRHIVQWWTFPDADA